jgi:hypothetical protein
MDNIKMDLMGVVNTYEYRLSTPGNVSFLCVFEVLWDFMTLAMNTSIFWNLKKLKLIYD